MIFLALLNYPMQGKQLNYSLKDKRVLVTGATGFIGGYTARRLHQEGAQVFALERTSGKGNELRKAGITVIEGDITDFDHMAEIISQDINVVMHIAAWLSGDNRKDAHQVNVTATQKLAEFSAQADVARFVYTSSIAVYGPHGDADVTENTPLKLYGDPYGDSKILSERVLHEVSGKTGSKYAIVRPGMVYGPGSRGWTARIAKWAKAGRLPFPDNGAATAYPIYIDNLVDLLLLCAEHNAAVGQTYNGVDDGPVTLADFMGAYMQMVPTTRALRFPCWMYQLAGRVINPFTTRNYIYIASQLCSHGQVLNDKAKRELGWEPVVSLNEGLKRSELWLREEGIL